MSFFERQTFYVISYEHGNIVGRLVPFVLARHIVVYGASVDFQAFEGDVLHFAFFVVAIDDRHIGLLTIITNIAEGDVFNAEARCFAVFLIPTHFHLRDASLKDAFDADVVERHVAHQVVVAAIDGHAALVVNLWLGLTEDVDGIVYSTCLAMGFAGVWGVWFCSDVIRPLLPSLMEQAIFLFLILVPIHLASGTMMGYFFGLARDKKYKLLNSLKALFLAILVDGLLCSLVFFIGNSWTYYFILGILFSILSMVFYTQIYHLLEKDVEEAKENVQKRGENS